MLLNNFYEFLVRKTDFDIPFFIDEKALYTRYDLYKVVFLLWKRINKIKIKFTHAFQYFFGIPAMLSLP